MTLTALVCVTDAFFVCTVLIHPPPPPSAGMKIVYMHDDTETLKDAVGLRLTDGVHTVQGTAQVTVLPVNDQKPRLIKYKHIDVEFSF